MNYVNWERIEKLLDTHHVKPIVGCIPSNQDAAFHWQADEHFWEHVADWAAKGWTIAQHGATHKMHPPKFESGGRYYQRSHSRQTELAGVPLKEQQALLGKGYQEMLSHGVPPTAFFAPAHTYDANTVAAVKTLAGIRFISDGYALRAYRKDGMTFLPSICDGPFALPFGTYTFVFHPSVMDEAAFSRLEKFLSQNAVSVITAGQALQHVQPRQGCIGWLLEYGIWLARGLRKALRQTGKRHAA